MSEATIGAGQCIDGERSTPAPVCSFQRQVAGIAKRAPNAAITCAAGRPIIPATWPQIALPTVRQPKNAVTKIASPRPRTQSGSATWADTLRLAKTAIQDAPATALPANAIGALRANAYRTIARAVPNVPAATSWSAPSFAFSQGNAKAAPTAAAPMVPRRYPYRSGPPAI